VDFGFDEWASLVCLDDFEIEAGEEGEQAYRLEDMDAVEQYSES
jgi:hypothetical protein